MPVRNKILEKNTRVWCACVCAPRYVPVSAEASKEASPTVDEAVGIALPALITPKESP